MIRIRKKQHNNNDLYKELRKLKAEHIRKISSILPLTVQNIYRCSNDKLEIEINVDRYDWFRISVGGIYMPTDKHKGKEYIKENIDKILFIISQIKIVNEMNLTQTIYFTKKFNYSKLEESNENL